MKKILSLVIVLSLLISSVNVFGAEYKSQENFYSVSSGITYQDIAYLPVDNWSNNAIFTMSALGIMKGAYNQFNPYGDVTASEALAVIFRCAGLENQCGKMYAAVETQRKMNPNLYNTIDRWADGYLRMAVDKKLITVEEFMSTMDINYPNNSKLFEKNKPITRATFAIWLIKTLDIELAQKESYIKDFEDYSKIKESDKIYLETAVRNGIISGDGKNILPNGTVTREQLAQIMYNSMNLWVDKCGIQVINGHIDDIVKNSVKNNDKILNTTKFKIGNAEIETSREYKLNGEAVDYTEDTSLMYVDFPVLRKHYLPADSSALEKSQKVEVYVQGNKVMFVNIADEYEAISSIDYSEYNDSKVYVGKLYLTDTQEQLFIIKDEKGEAVEIPYFTGVEVYHKNVLLNVEELNETYLDKTIYLFTLKKTDIGFDRCYKAQIITEKE